MQKFRDFLKSRKAATAIEYGLIGALVSVAAIGAMTSLNGQLKTTFDAVATNMSGAVATMGS